MTDSVHDLSIVEDLLQGAGAIAAFTGDSARRIYYLASIGEIPTFFYGGKICMRKSSFRAMLAERERAAERKAVDA